MTESAIWQYTPPPGSDYCVPAPTPAPHSEHVTYVASSPYSAKCPTCTLSQVVSPTTVVTAAATATLPTGTVYAKPASSTVAAFTGAAAGNSVELFSIIAGVLLAIPMLL
jgi:hypothetical protein